MNFERQRSLRGSVALLLGVGSALVVASCVTDRGAPHVEGSDASLPPTLPIESSVARDRIDELRVRFRLGAQHGSRPVIERAVARAFEARGDGIHPVLPEEAIRRTPKPATTTLPSRAAGYVEIVDRASRLSVRFALRGASDTSIAISGGIALYSGAFEGHDVVHRVTEEGTEDY